MIIIFHLKNKNNLNGMWTKSERHKTALECHSVHFLNESKNKTKQKLNDISDPTDKISALGKSKVFFFFFNSLSNYQVCTFKFSPLLVVTICDKSYLNVTFNTVKTNAILC